MTDTKTAAPCLYVVAWMDGDEKRHWVLNLEEAMFQFRSLPNDGSHRRLAGPFQTFSDAFRSAVKVPLS